MWCDVKWVCHIVCVCVCFSQCRIFSRNVIESVRFLRAKCSMLFSNVFAGICDETTTKRKKLTYERVSEKKHRSYKILLWQIKYRKIWSSKKSDTCLHFSELCQVKIHWAWVAHKQHYSFQLKRHFMLHTTRSEFSFFLLFPCEIQLVKTLGQNLCW